MDFVLLNQILLESIRLLIKKEKQINLLHTFEVVQ